MANTPMKVLLTFAGVLVAGLGTAYFAGAFNASLQPSTEQTATATPGFSDEQGTGDTSNEVRVTAVTPDTGRGKADDSAKPERLGAAPAGTNDGAATNGAMSGGETGNGATNSDAGQPDVVVPSFDVLRVEPNGSMVVAGKAAPNAEVEVLNGSSVLATAQTGGSGDFAAVLDTPLKPGEHNIVLRGTSPDNVATSVETAIVSIPSSEEGQVVALVQEPGKPSRLITVPQPTAAGSKDSKDQQEVAAESGSDTGGGAETAPVSRETDQQTGKTVAQSGDANDSSDESGSDKARATAGGKTQDPETSAESGQNVAAAGGESEQNDPAGNESAKTSPFIEAVEIDGRQVFVAGKAEPGRRVRVYLNDILLGQTDVTPEGSFLIEAERDLPVGDYLIRVDVLDDDGASVIARAAVPFERPADDHFAAIAGNSADRQSGAKDTGSIPREAASGNTVSSPATPEEKSLKAGRLPSRNRATVDDTGKAGASSRKPADITMGASKQADDARKSIMPPLNPAEGTVIIRRGDTLWHLSRRVYGRGVRYSTIYLANEDQIRDPDLIYPGQTFTLPDKTEQGETANFNAIEDQALLPEDPPVEADG